MSETYFSSDYHLGHFNIIRYCERPFTSLDQMNDTIIKRHNERVKPLDNFYHIGDFCFRNSSDRKNGIRINAQEWMAKLNGCLIFLKGNHDRNNSLKCRMTSCVYQYGHVEYWLCHKPEDANPAYKINLVGHVHEKWKFKSFGTHDCINVGCDVWNFYPKTLDEMLRSYNQWKQDRE